MPNIDAERLWALIGRVRGGERKTIHCIMNYVAAPDCANALLAVGARPVMADCPDECAEITARSAALVLNMGTFSAERGRAMLASGRTANENGIPVIIDPVGLQVSGLRREWFGRLTEELGIAAVKGNRSEISAVVGSESVGEELAKRAAEKLGCAVLVTGDRDCLSDGKRVLTVMNGTGHLTEVTGTGCMTGALIGAFAAEGEPFEACAAAVSLMDICGERAAEDFRGTGTFRTELTDALSQLTKEEYLKSLKMTVS